MFGIWCSAFVISKIMRILLPTDHPLNLQQFLQRAGYASHRNRLGNRLSFVKRLSAGLYPRFHLYVGKNLSGRTYFNLHLDQKQPSYLGAHAHSGEYDGPLVANEAERLHQLLQAVALPPGDQPPLDRSWWPWRVKS